MLSQHRYYVYYEGCRVYARMDQCERVLVEECESPQAAHDKVQSIINPSGRPAQSFWEERAVVDEHGKPIFDDKGKPIMTKVNVGFHAKEFQDAISENCREVVEAAYARSTQ